MTIQFGILIIILLILLQFSQYFSNILKIIDNPDNKRKLHKAPTPLFGGPAIFIVLILYNSIQYYFYQNNYTIWNMIFLTIIFLVGFIDDRNGVSPNKKLLFLFIAFYIFIQFNDSINIQNLEFTTFLYKINLGMFSTLFLTFCALLLINALNMTDGKNGLCASIQIIILLILISFSNNKINNSFEITYIIFLLIFLIFNLNGKVFLGDSGVYLGAFIIINKIFYCYESISYFKVEQIFILLMIPGIDMFRVFLIRLIKKKSPFEGDRNHFHHLLEKKFNNFQCLIIYLLLISLSNMLSIYFPQHSLLNVIITFSIYILIIYNLKNNKYENYNSKH